jgi:hypothetical protein
MGATRKPTTSDAAYARGRAAYLKRREAILAQAKEKYQRDRPMLLAATQAGRDAAKDARLLAKRRALYGEQFDALPDVQYASAKEFIRRYKAARPCLDCGVSYPFYVMDFDHVRGTKRKEVSSLSTLKSIKAEIEKCDLVCANCHRHRTFSRK